MTDFDDVFGNNDVDMEQIERELDEIEKSRVNPYANFASVYDGFNALTPFRVLPEGSRGYPFLGMKQVRALFDTEIGDQLALFALAVAFLCQEEHEVGRRETVVKNKRGLQGGHATAGTSLGLALTTSGVKALQSLNVIDHWSKAHKACGWGFDGKLDRDPMQAALRLGRRYAGVLADVLRDEAVRRSSDAEKARLRSFSVG